MKAFGRIWKKTTAALLILLMLLLGACSNAGGGEAEDASGESDGGQGTSEESTAAPENGEVVILFTSDIHCGIDEGFGFAGLQQIRDELEAEGYTVILVDDGDAVQGETIGTLSNGEAIIKLMNAMHYDVAIPGNHEFDYGMEEFLHLTEMAEFPYVSCNFNKEGELVFAPYVIKEAAGHKIAFIGVTTPTTLTSSTPSTFQNEAGEYNYGFLQDDDGEALYAAVQKSIDDARAEGADYVYVLGHLGYYAEVSPWSYADVIENTTGIDVFLDGHSHDTEQVVMKDKAGNDVPRSACGTKMNCIGYSYIHADGTIETNIWSWSNKIGAPRLMGLHNEMDDEVRAAQEALAAETEKVVAQSNVELTIYDPVEVDNSGNPIRMIRRAETNLGDFCADAFRIQCGTDVGIISGGGIRANIERGDITYGDIIDVFPFGNEVCVMEVTGQQLLDALEWTSRSIPGENGGFLQVSGMSYEIDVSVPSGCIADENGMCIGIEGERRVKNVMVGGEPIDPQKTYTVASIDYILKQNGDGITAFDGAKVLRDGIMIDNQLLINYITEALGGEIGGEYADPYGQGRIVILNGGE
ncbi:MAG: bifunctional metallophosphatase/5'-nucleotidase [Mogibacterium sp.]|nr:bifunctional metallophosphatase/5'-nucleotidase [Mogibacterium sp.]